MPRAKKLPFDNVGELLERLGNIPARRVCLDPRPGLATKEDLLDRTERGSRLYEMVDGTLVEKPMGSPESHVASELGFYLRTFLAAHNLGYMYTTDALIELLPDLVRGPDVSFTSWEKRPERTVPDRPIADIPPDLAVEVVSRRNTRAELARKRKEYFLAGTRLVWEVNHRTRTAVAYTAPDVRTLIPTDGTLDGGDVLPGFRLPLTKLFGQLPPPAAAEPKRRKK